MARTNTSFKPTEENLKLIKQNRIAIESLETRSVPCLCCGFKTINLHQKTTEPIYISLKCCRCKFEATYNLADYRRGISLKNLLKLANAGN
jgi:hypothetical protein